MTLNQPTRIALGRLLAHLRSDWNAAGCHDACSDLASQTGTPFQLCLQAVSQAAVAGNRTPARVLVPVAREAVVRQLNRPLPVEPCPEHGGTIVGADGVHSCCRFADAAPLPVSRTAHPPPPAVTALVQDMKTKGTR